MPPGCEEGFSSLDSTLLCSHLSHYLTVIKNEEDGKDRNVDKELEEPFKSKDPEEGPYESEVLGE